MEQVKEHYKMKYHITNCYYQTAYESAVHIEEILLNTKNQEDELLFIEVSFDQYDDVMNYLSQEEAVQMLNLQDMIYRGAFTYDQVKNIAKACCIHELKLLDDGQIELQVSVLSMSALMSFALSKWNGATRETAIKNAVLTGMSIYGETFTEEVILHHLEKHEAEYLFADEKKATMVIAKNGTKSIAKKMATKVTKKAMLSSAVAKKTIMLLNANVVTGALVTGVMSTVDIVRAVKGQLSPHQLFKNITKTAASVAGGIIGMIIFAGIGFNIPSVSTAVISLIGGVIGLILGSLVMTKVATKILDLFIKEDSAQMLEIFNDVLAVRAEAYMLNAEELQEAIKDFNEHYDMKKELRNMYAADNHHLFAETMINHEMSRIVKQRMYLHVPSDDEVYETLQHI